jgi:uncharacterized protein
LHISSSTGETVVCAADAADGRLYQFTQLNQPDVLGYAAHVNLVDRSCLTIDDDNGSQNPTPIKVGGLYNLTGSVLRGGSKVTKLVGPLFYSFSLFRVQPLDQADLIIENIGSPQRVAAPPFITKASEVKVAFTNLLNYFTTLDASSATICNGLAPRGANNAVEFARQATKTTLALSQIDADIFAFSELENCPSATTDLLSRLNGASSSRIYKAVSIEKGYTNIGTDAIKVELVYDSLKLTLVGSAMLTDANVDSTILSQSIGGVIFNGRSRVPLAATFNGTQGVITVVANHFKSKGCSGATGLDADKSDGQGCFNKVRTLSAEALLTWLGTSP